MMTPTPYKGLAPYEREDRDNFFGRDQDKDILVGKILAHRLTLLYAGTGVGKSSLLGAAVIPELEDVAHDNLDVVYHRTWTTDPLQAIRNAVGETLVRRQKLVARDLPALAPTLSAFLKQCCVYSSDPLVLILDQFEELFRYHAGQPMLASCIEELAQVMTDRSLPVAVVLSMREDFLAELSVFRGRVPDLFSNYYRLHKLSAEQARAAVLQPVERPVFGFHYEPGVVDTLLDDLAAQPQTRQDLRRPDLPPPPFAVEGPYLQIVCTALWEQEHDNPTKTIRQTTYQRLGGVRAMVQQYFARVMQSCNRSERRLAARAFSFLVTEGGAKMAYPETVLARILKVRLRRLQPVLHKLNAARVLRDDRRPEGTWYELYHDGFADIINTWAQTVEATRRWYIKLGVAVVMLGLFAMLGLLGYQQYRSIYNLGTLEVQNQDGATLSLTCVHHYGEKATCQKGVRSVGTSLSLPGPADYVLTAEHGSTGRYPVYIQGYGHRVVLTVRPPPAPPPGMAYIPGGVFRMGDKDDRDGMGDGDELPHHDAAVHGFFLDRYEVTNTQYQQCVAAGVCEPPHYEDETCYRSTTDEKSWAKGKVEPIFQEASRPVSCVDWHQAQLYCEKFMDKRLPTEAEWEKAAVGPEGYKWSFGNTFDGAKLNFCDAECDFTWKDTQARDGHRWTAPVGSYPGNGYGLYDMSGNVWEWVQDWYDETFYSTTQAEQPNPLNVTEGKKGRGRGVRGGGWDGDAANSRAASRGRDTPEDRFTDLGFRCALAAQ